MAYYNVYGSLDTVECKCEGHDVFGMALDDRDVPSVCYISGLNISGRQFFPSEGIRQGKKVLDFAITIAVRDKVLIKHRSNLWKILPGLVSSYIVEIFDFIFHDIKYVLLLLIRRINKIHMHTLFLSKIIHNSVRASNK